MHSAWPSSRSCTSTRPTPGCSTSGGPATIRPSNSVAAGSAASPSLLVLDPAPDRDPRRRLPGPAPTHDSPTASSIEPLDLAQIENFDAGANSGTGSPLRNGLLG